MSQHIMFSGSTAALLCWVTEQYYSM